MKRVDIIEGAIATYGRSESPAALARHIEAHLSPVDEPAERAANALERIARCVENIDARQANSRFASEGRA